ncbi:MAG: peptidylprolyl isomerase [Deltaproteobacteria bacterium]|nr:peptidylprolyl isomerase [Deltaproteobacteria bacterium]
MTEAQTKKFSAPTQPTVNGGKKYSAVIHTAKGEIKLDLFAKEAPLSVTNFIQLAKGGFYNGLTFHRVVPNFVIQGGDPQGNGSGGPGYTVKAEIQGNPHKHVEGALAWARLGDEVNPKRDSSGSQFYITLAPTPFLDNQYTVFGQTTSGMDVVKKIAVGDKIQSVEIVEK